MRLLLAWLGILLIGFTGLATIAWGWFAWLPLVVIVGDEYGRQWAMAAFVSGVAATLAVALGLWRIQDHFARKLDWRTAANTEITGALFCPSCGLFKPGRYNASKCPSCGSPLTR